MTKFIAGVDYIVPPFNGFGLSTVTLAGRAREHPIGALTLPQGMLLSYAWNEKLPIAVVKIINYHIIHDRDILMCQDELIEAGYEKWARL